MSENDFRGELVALYDEVGPTIRRWAVLLAEGDSEPRLYDSLTNAESEGGDQEDLREFLEGLPSWWTVEGGVVSVNAADGTISAYKVGVAKLEDLGGHSE